MSRNSANDDRNRKTLEWMSFGFEVVKFAVSIGILYYGLRTVSEKLLASLDNHQTDSVAEKKSLAKRLKRPEVEAMTFDQYELKLLDAVVGVDELEMTFADIGGLEAELEEVHDNVVLPIKLWKLQQKNRSLDNVAPVCPIPTGIMLFGMPGTGKSLIGKAIAKECGATFINIKSSQILDKYVGESDKLAASLFRVGRKLGPTIVFIDEIETLLRKRDNNDRGGNTVIQTLQGVFLSEWDGLSVERDATLDKAGRPSSQQPPVVILGATNRPMDIDPAFARRMPVRIETHVPTQQDRVSILRALLKRVEHVSPDVDLEAIAAVTDGCTGSDLREILRVATLQREKAKLAAAQEALLNGTYATTEKGHHHDAPVLTAEHFAFALNKHHTAVRKTAEFNAQVIKSEASDSVNMFLHQLNLAQKAAQDKRAAAEAAATAAADEEEEDNQGEQNEIEKDNRVD